MKRYVFVTRGSYEFSDGVIDFVVYRDSQQGNTLVRTLRLGNTKQWYIPKEKMHAEVATKLSLGKSVTVQAIWDPTNDGGGLSCYLRKLLILLSKTKP